MSIKEQQLKLKRIIDDALTGRVLGTIGQSALHAAKEAAHQMSTSNIGGGANNNLVYYYLKGGKSLQVLQNQVGGGDWDFQVKPVNTVYTNWTTAGGGANDELTRLHNGIITMLWNVANTCLGQGNLLGNEAVGSHNLIDRDPNNIPNDDFHKKIKKIFQEVTQLKAKEVQIKSGYSGNAGYLNTYVVGPNLLHSTEADLLTHANFNKEEDGRMTLNPNQVQVDPGILGLPNNHANYFDQLQPRVYVNCSIPGFILYRLAIFYNIRFVGNYIPNELRELAFKSELIDISIPRKGTPESRMHLNNITHLKDMPWNPPDPLREVRVPGWRYHMLENMNLYSEIKLGVSSSPHKIKKRRDRGGDAIDKLCRVQDGGVITVQQMLNNGAIWEWPAGPNRGQQLQSYVPLFKQEITQLDGGQGVNQYVNQVIDREFGEIFAQGRITNLNGVNQAREVGATIASLREHIVFPDCSDLLGILGKMLTSKGTRKIKLNMIMSAASILKWNLKDFNNNRTPMIYPQAAARFKVNQDAYNEIKEYTTNKNHPEYGNLKLKKIEETQIDHADALLVQVIKKGGRPTGRSITTIIVQEDATNWDNAPNVEKVTNSTEKLITEADLSSLIVYRDQKEVTTTALRDVVSNTSIASIRYPLAEAVQNLKMVN